ncbi:MAG: hypothetical protein KF763_20030 [Cyclobacteriaceae bacterium]|nr:hypothetical protein [Cyclobacteriaceae bacterium]
MKKLTLLYLLASHYLFAQVTTPNTSTTFYQANLYDHHLGANSTLYTGARFIDEFAQQQTEGNYYYHQNDWAIGKISLNGQLYDSITMRYNLLLNQVIILNNYTGESLVAQKEKINYFELFNTRFVFLTKPEPGYYAELSTGIVKPYVRYSCRQNERIINGKLVREMIIRKKYFLQKGEVFYPIKSRRSALKVFGSKSSELRRNLRQANISFSSQKEMALAAMSKYFDQLEQ